MRVQGDISPSIIAIENYHPISGFVEVRIRENIRKIDLNYASMEQSRIAYIYDEYTFIVPNRENLYDEIENNLDEWIKSGKACEINESASGIQDMKQALKIMGVSL